MLSRGYLQWLWLTGVCSYMISSNEPEDSAETTGMEGYGVWYSKDDILATLNTTEHMQLAGVRAAIATYQELLANPPYDPLNDPQMGFRQPFIAIEGTHRDSRIIIGKEVASFLQSTYLGNPPRTMVTLRKMFDKEKGILRKAYFSLSMYVGAHHVRETWTKEPVVTTGYWLDQAAFSIAQRFTLESLPPPGSKIYQWPQDLVRPDVAFFLNIPQLKRSDRPVNTFKPKLAEVYRRLQGVKIIEINTTGTYRKIFAIIRSRLNGMFTFKLYNQQIEQSQFETNEQEYEYNNI